MGRRNTGFEDVEYVEDVDFGGVSVGGDGTRG